MALPLLATKLHRPTPGPDLVLRPRLLEALDRGLGRRLTLVSAPAGFGKTTLVARWMEERAIRGGWLSVDPSDRDAPRFWSYLVAALEGVDGLATDRVQALLQSPDPDLPSVVATLLNDLAELEVADPRERPAVLVLDDLHAVETPEIHETLTLFVDHLPPALRLVIVSRSDPPLPLARYRARQDLLELRQAELRFSREEAARYLNEVRALGLPERTLEALERRTEGWAASLQLAALSLARLGPAEHDAFVQAFAGDDRYVMDFLVDEVLSRQPEPVQRFLLATSVLDRMTGPLCRAVLQEAGWPDGVPVPGLPELERSGLFVVPLDTRREWYRYHHLFRELLRIRCRDEMDEAALLRAASRWLVEEDLIEEAVEHAFRAGDVEGAADILEAHFTTLIGLGETRLVRRFVARVPAPRVQASVSLCMAMAYCAYLHTLLEEAEVWIERAQAVLPGTDPTEARLREQTAHLALLRGFRAEAHQDGAAADRRYREAAEGFTVRDFPYMRTVVDQGLAGVAFAEERLGDAEGAARRAIRLGFEHGNLLAGTTALSRLGMVLVAAGRLEEAESAARDHALELRDAVGGRGPLLEAYAHARRAEALIHLDRLDEAAELLDAAEEVARPGNAPTTLATVLLERARLGLARGDVSGARSASRELDGLFAANRVLLLVRRLHEVLRVRILLADGEPGRAEAWSRTVEGDPGGDPGGPFPTPTGLARARIALATDPGPGTLRTVAATLERLEERARRVGAGGWAVEAAVLRAHALDRLRDGSATGVLAGALRTAAPQGELRIFLDGGAEMAELVSRAQSKAGTGDPDGVPGAFVAELLGAFGRRGKEADGLLSERELEVLRLLDAGLSNQEVADRLFVTVGTIKKHAHNIYRKLGASRRSEALARAREVGVLG